MDEYGKTLKLLREKGQEQVLRYWDELNGDEQKELLREISQVDFKLLSLKEDKETLKNISPIGALTVTEISKQRDKFFEAGAQAIREGKIAAILLAGGQGTRLGSAAPKGTFDIGVTRHLYVFERLIQNLQEVCNACGATVPLLIMTSEKNDAATRAFLKEHSYFGYPQEKVRFFCQEMAACADLDGKLLLEEKGRLARSPNGNGGWYTSLETSGILEDALLDGVEWFNVFAVDNVLQRIADPVFVGATLLSGCKTAAKVVSRRPNENVGVLCLENGIPCVVEYYELKSKLGDLADACDADGNLLYRFGVILNYLFDRKMLAEIADKKIPVHAVQKKVPYLDPQGNRINPETPNGYKYETLILDLIKLMGSCLACEVERDREFAPIKNATGIDSVDTARELLKKNGVEL